MLRQRWTAQLRGHSSFVNICQNLRVVVGRDCFNSLGDGTPYTLALQNDALGDLPPGVFTGLHPSNATEVINIDLHRKSHSHHAPNMRRCNMKYLTMFRC